MSATATAPESSSSCHCPHNLGPQQLAQRPSAFPASMPLRSTAPRLVLPLPIAFPKLQRQGWLVPGAFRNGQGGQRVRGRGWLLLPAV